MKPASPSAAPARAPVSSFVVFLAGLILHSPGLWVFYAALQNVALRLRLGSALVYVTPYNPYVLYVAVAASMLAAAASTALLAYWYGGRPSAAVQQRKWFLFPWGLAGLVSFATWEVVLTLMAGFATALNAFSGGSADQATFAWFLVPAFVYGGLTAYASATAYWKTRPGRGAAKIALLTLASVTLGVLASAGMVNFAVAAIE